MKVGLIGYGYWGGGFVARNIARVAELAVIADPDPDSIVRAAGDWGRWGTKVVTEPEVAFRECDAVWIATPVDTHKDIVLDALNSGCHVMCEKPFMTDAHAAESAVVASKVEGLVLMAGHLSLYMGQHGVAQARIRQLRGYQEDIEERKRQGMVEMQPPFKERVLLQRFTDRPSQSDRSVLWGLGPHDVATLVDLFGFPEETIWNGNDHRVIGELFFGGDVEARVELDWLCTKKSRSFIIGTSGNLAEVPDKVEPLFAEAQAFVQLVEGRDHDEMLRQRELITKVTTVLAIAEKQMKEAEDERVSVVA